MRRAVFFIMGILWSASISAESPASIQLRLYTEEYPPFNYTYKAKIIGINTELMQQVSDDLGYGALFEVVPWGRAQRFTQTQPDTCFFSAVRTADRETLYSWVGPLIKEHVQLFSLDPEHPKFSHFSEVKKLRIGGQSADAYTDFGASQGLNIDPVAEIPVNLSRLELGRIDLWLAGSIGGPFIASRKGLRLYPVVTSEKVFELWLACNKQMPEAIILQLNSSLQTKQQDGSLDEIMARYR